MKASAFVMFAVLAVASAAGICQRTTCEYSSHTNSQGAAYFRTRISWFQQPELENFNCGKASGSNDCECVCDPTYKCTLAHDTDGEGDVKSFHHCGDEQTAETTAGTTAGTTEIVVPVLLQLKSSSPLLQSQWSVLTDQTTDSELDGLALSGVTMVGSSLRKLTLQGKQLTGPVPSFAANTKLRYLYLQNNQLTGKIPDFSKNLALQILSLKNNQLTGPVPSFAANTKLRYLYLQSNQLTGSAGWKLDNANCPFGCHVVV